MEKTLGTHWEHKKIEKKILPLTQNLREKKSISLTVISPTTPNRTGLRESRGVSACDAHATTLAWSHGFTGRCLHICSGPACAHPSPTTVPPFICQGALWWCMVAYYIIVTMCLKYPHANIFHIKKYLFKLKYIEYSKINF
jgi:hypothetical protein